MIPVEGLAAHAQTDGLLVVPDQLSADIGPGAGEHGLTAAAPKAMRLASSPTRSATRASSSARFPGS